MDDLRERDLLTKVDQMVILDEATGFREQLCHQGEMTGAVMVRLTARIDVLAAKEGRR